jgi:hypothetical protein
MLDKVRYNDCVFKFNAKAVLSGAAFVYKLGDRLFEMLPTLTVDYDIDGNFANGIVPRNITLPFTIRIPLSDLPHLSLS